MMNPPLSFVNEHIQLHVEKHPECKIIFSITTLPPATKAAQIAANRAVAKEVNIPGFRKGKAPAALITQQFSDQIKKEFLDVITRNSMYEAFRLSGIHPLNNQSQVKLLKCEPIDDAAYLISIEFESYPDIPKIDPASLSITTSKPEIITDNQVNDRMEDLRLHHCTWEEISDRPAQDGDFVTLKVAIEKDTQAETIHENSRFHLKEGRLPNWLRKAIIGLSIGDSATVNSEREDKMTEDFEAKSFIVTVNKIEQALLPAIDDDLAKKGGVETIELLKEAMVKSLEKETQNKAMQTDRLAIKQVLLESYPFELPGEQLKELQKDCDQMAAQNAHLDPEKLKIRLNQMFENGKKNISFSYLLSKLYKDSHLEFPTPAIIQQRATEEMIRHYMQGDRSITENDLENYTRIAENEIIAETALDYLIDNSQKN